MPCVCPMWREHETKSYVELVGTAPCNGLVGRQKKRAPPPRLSCWCPCRALLMNGFLKEELVLTSNQEEVVGFCAHSTWDVCCWFANYLMTFLYIQYFHLQLWPITKCINCSNQMHFMYKLPHLWLSSVSWTEASITIWQASLFMDNVETVCAFHLEWRLKLSKKKGRKQYHSRPCGKTQCGCWYLDLNDAAAMVTMGLGAFGWVGIPRSLMQLK